MRHRIKSSPSVNLFAFLDILICTMGALILMLMVVTTRQLRKDSLADVLAELKTRPLPQLSIEAPELPAVAAPDPIVILAEPEPLEPESPEPAVDSREQLLAERAAALAQRERELNDLVAEWRRKTTGLATERDQRAKSLEQRRRLKDVAAQQVLALQDEASDLEAKLTGTRPVSSSGDSTLAERRLIEQQIAAVQKRLKAAQVAAAGSESKFMVVPFDPQSGTSRRPILIECTADGLRFLPENIVIRPDDLEGFTQRVNPLLAGSNSLVTYWTAWNLKQPQPSREPEPYVLLLVRPSGTVAYYIALKMLTSLQQPHGYELIEEETQLQQPPLDPQAKATCEAAVNRLLAERDQIKGFASKKSGGTLFNRGGGSTGDGTLKGSIGKSGAGGPVGSGQTGEQAAHAGTTNRFEVADVVGDENEVGSRSWERIENFAGRNGRSTSLGGQQPSGQTSAGQKTGGQQQVVAQGAGGLSSEQRKVQGFENEPDANGKAAGTNGRRAVESDGVLGHRTVATTPGNQSAVTEASGTGGGSSQVADSGIERLTNEDDEDASSGGPVGADRGAKALDIGLGSSRPTSVPVVDRRTKKSSSNNSLEPELLSHKHWGLSAADAAIGLEREVRVVVEPTRLVVGGKHAIRMGEGESKQETLERLVTVLDLQARDWGQPPQGFFWKPSLRFVVVKDGNPNPNYEQARSLAEKSGLTTSKEYASPALDKATLTATPVGATPPVSKPTRTARGGRP